MTNFERQSRAYRAQVHWRTESVVDQLVMDYLSRGGKFDARKINDIFNTALQTAQLLTDLEIGAGLISLNEEKDDDSSDGNEVCDLRERNPEGSTGDFGNEGRVRNPSRQPDQTDDNGSAGSGKVDPPKQQPPPYQSGPGERRRYVSGPPGSEIYPTPGNGPSGVGPSVPDVRG